jgi:Ca2+-binding RTX toxin-like protein
MRGFGLDRWASGVADARVAGRRVLAGTVIAAALLASSSLPALGSTAAPMCGEYRATIRGTDASEVLRGTAGRDVIVGKDGNDEIHGGGGNDIVCGGLGNDQVFGESGDDLFLAETDATIGTGQNDGADVFDGGSGHDIASYRYRYLPVWVDLNAVGGGHGYRGENDDVQSRVEEVEGGYSFDDLTGRDDTTDTLRGGPGADRIWGDDNETGGRADFLYGDDGPDQLIGLAGADELYGGPGGDRIWGGDDGDRIDGGPGNDTLKGGAGNDWFEEAGNVAESASAGDGADVFHGEAGFDCVGYDARTHGVWVRFDGVANDGAARYEADEAVQGTEGDNVRSDVECLRGSQGSDDISAWSLEAGPGQPVPGLTIFGWNGSDTIVGGPGNDLLYGDFNAPGLPSRANIAYNDDVIGGPGEDRIYGGHGDDYLDGGVGADVVDGTDGYESHDRLFGSREPLVPDDADVDVCLPDFQDVVDLCP